MARLHVEGLELGRGRWEAGSKYRGGYYEQGAQDGNAHGDAP
jgi:hypothetical protein